MSLHGLNDSDVALLKKMANAFRHSALNLAPYRARGHGGCDRGVLYPIPVKCTTKDTAAPTTTPAPTTTSGGGTTTPAPTTTDDGTTGYGTFKECDWNGNILTGDDERVFKNCRIAGDFDKDFDLSVASGNETFGLLYNIKGQNVVHVIPDPIAAYYSE